MKRIEKTRGWRFRFSSGKHPDEPAGIETNNRGGVLMAEGAESVRQSILMLLSTRPGERIGRPSYGCDLRKLVFEPNDQTTAGLARHYARRAIERWEPRAAIKSLSAGPEAPGSPRLLLSIEYRVKGIDAHDTVRFALDLS